MSLLNSGLYLVRIASLLYHIVDSGRRLEFLPTNIRKTRKPVEGMCSGDNELAFENRVEPRLSFPLGEYSSFWRLGVGNTAVNENVTYVAARQRLAIDQCWNPTIENPVEPSAALREFLFPVR